jgi:hypothetical protein
VNDSVMESVKRFFHDRGIETGGGITYTINESNEYETFCYSDPQHRRLVRGLAELIARHHNEFILDDFFFTSCKSDVEIDAKGDSTWAQYRQALLAEAGRPLVVDPAHRVNPAVSAIIKYPNWYEHFPGLGFDLDAGPRIFDGIWTGTETRDPASAQHLQNYLGYEVVRYFENCAPGRNLRGWVDMFRIDGPRLGADRYADQLWLTMFSKAKQVALFAYGAMLDRPLNASIHRTIWQGQGSSFDWENCTAPYQNDAGETIVPTTVARIAGCALY